jgi:hypothetical protein
MAERDRDQQERQRQELHILDEMQEAEAEAEEEAEANSAAHVAAAEPAIAVPAESGAPSASMPNRTPSPSQAPAAAPTSLSRVPSLQDPAAPSASASASQPAAAPPSPPLHRRVHLDGLSGRFLRGVVSALSGASSGSQHLLLDVTWTPVAEQLDARRLAHLMAATGAIFGLSCDLLVCHAQTTAAHFSLGAPSQKPLSPVQLKRSVLPPFDRNPSTSSTLLSGSPELGPTSDFMRQHPPAAGSQMGQNAMEAATSLSIDASSPMSIQVDSADGDWDDPRPNMNIPSPPPLAAPSMAPRRESYDRYGAGTYASMPSGPQTTTSGFTPLGYDDDGQTWSNGSATGDYATDGDASAFPMSPSPDAGGVQPSSRGPIFSNIFIAHHLHNAPRDVQDVLLQALKLKQISVDGLPVNLPAVHRQ